MLFGPKTWAKACDGASAKISSRKEGQGQEYGECLSKGWCWHWWWCWKYQGVRHGVNAKCRARTGSTEKSFQRENWQCSTAPLQFVFSPPGTCPRFWSERSAIRAWKGPRPRPRQRRQRPRPTATAPDTNGQSKEAKTQRGKEGKTRKKEERHPWRLNWKKAATISILSVPQIMHLDFFLCGTIRPNQDEPLWIVAQRLLSALTIPGAFNSSAKEITFQQRLRNWSHINLTSKRNSHVTKAKA